MIEHFELAQESRSCLSGAELCQEGRVIELRNAPCECSLCAAVDRFKYVRLSSEDFPDLVGPQLETLSTLCLAASRSEEFFLSANATNQCLRTIIGHESLHPKAWTEAETWIDLIPSFIIHSNILPYDPYWSKLLATRDETRTRLHFPSYVLKEALEESKSLETKLLEWRSAGKECEIAKHATGRCEDESFEQPRTSKLFWQIQRADVKLVRVIAAGSDGTISLITWKGGMFVRKEFKESQAHIELKVVKMFSHPHIVYSFGELCDGTQTSYFMEYMSNDLFHFIVNRARRAVGDNEPPFSRHDTIDVLSQAAKAMRHMHQENVNVVHCDLKSVNVLISEIATSDNVKHFLVKVADFGSAQLVNSSSSSSGFIAGAATTNYAAPEVLRQRVDKNVRIDFPHKIDVYSFGIVAFEVLTGKNNGKAYEHSPSKFKRGVIEGNLRPPLRAECEKQKVFTQDKDLISLIERCWHIDPLERPSFVEICEELNKTSDQMLVSGQMLQSDHPPFQQNSFWNCFGGAGVLKKQKVSTSRNPS